MMRDDSDALQRRAEELRRAFDRSFAEPGDSARPATEDGVVVRTGGGPRALRIRDVEGIHVDLEVTPLPGTHAALLGIAVVRDRLAPVFDLAALLGGSPAGMPRWCVVARAQEPVALAFEAFDRHFRAAPRDFAPAGAGRGHDRFVSELLRLDGELLPVLDLPALVASVQRHARTSSASEEQ